MRDRRSSACRLRGVTGASCDAEPPRLRNFRSSSLVRAEPMYAASQPHGCKATSRSTANGIRSWRSAAKYQASGGTSYSASIDPAGHHLPGLASIRVIRSRNEYGGPGSRAMTRPSSKTRYGSPNASDGLPIANARMLVASRRTARGRVGRRAADAVPRPEPPQRPRAVRPGQPERHVGDLDDRLAVGEHQGVDDRVRLGPVAQLLDRDLVRDLPRRLDDLAAALEPAGDSRHRLDRRPRRARRPSPSASGRCAACAGSTRTSACRASRGRRRSGRS